MPQRFVPASEGHFGGAGACFDYVDASVGRHGADRCEHTARNFGGDCIFIQSEILYVFVVVIHQDALDAQVFERSGACRAGR